MKNRIVKSIAIAAAATVLLTSLGASAATHKCKKGEKWDAPTKTCVVKVAK